MAHAFLRFNLFACKILFNEKRTEMSSITIQYLEKLTPCKILFNEKRTEISSGDSKNSNSSKLLAKYSSMKRELKSRFRLLENEVKRSVACKILFNEKRTEILFATQ